MGVEVEEEEGGRKEDVRLGDRGTRLEPDKGFIEGAERGEGGREENEWGSGSAISRLIESCYSVSLNWSLE